MDTKREIPVGAAVGIGVAVLALFGGLAWWRSGAQGGSQRYSDAIRARESNPAFEENLNYERKVRQSNPQAFHDWRDKVRDRDPQPEVTR